MANPTAQALSPIPIIGITDPLDIAKFIAVSEITFPGRDLLFLPAELGATNPPASSLTPTLGLSDQILKAHIPDFLRTSGLAPAVCELSDLLCRAWVVRWHLLRPCSPVDGQESVQWAKDSKKLIVLAGDIISRDPHVWPALYQNRIFAVARLVLDYDKNWTLPPVFHQRAAQGWPEASYKVSDMMNDAHLWYPVNKWCNRCCNGAIKACTTRTETAVRCFPCKKLGKSCSNKDSNGDDSRNEDHVLQCGSKRKSDDQVIEPPTVKRHRVEAATLGSESGAEETLDGGRRVRKALLSIIQNCLNDSS